MGNFFTDDPTGAMLGAGLGGILGKLWKQNWDNRSYEKAAKIRDNQMSINNDDVTNAVQKVLKENGYSDFTGKNIYDAINMTKEDYEKYSKAKDAVYQDFLKAQASGDLDKAGSLEQQQKQWQTMMDQIHGRADSLRGIAAKNGWDMTGYGANDSLQSIRNRRNGTPTEGLGQGSFIQSLGILKDQDKLPQGQPQGFFGTLGLDKPPQQTNYNISDADLNNIIQNDPTLQALVNQTAQASRDARVASPNMMSDLEREMRKQGVDPEVMQNMLSGTKQSQDKQTLDQQIDDFVKYLIAGDYTHAFGTGLRAQQIDPNTAKSMFTGSPTPKNQWDVQVGRENAAINHAYNKETMADQSAHQERMSDKQYLQKVGLTKMQLDNELTRMAAQHGYQLDLTKLGFEQKVKLYERFGSMNSKNGNQQLKLQIDAANSIISHHSKWETDPLNQGQPYPYQKELDAALAIRSKNLGLGGSEVGGDSQGKYNVNNYNDAIKDATDRLTQATQAGGYTRTQIETMFRKLYGNMADDIVDNIDWKQWGY